MSILYVIIAICCVAIGSHADNCEAGYSGNDCTDVSSVLRFKTGTSVIQLANVGGPDPVLLIEGSLSTTNLTVALNLTVAELDVVTTILSLRTRIAALESSLFPSPTNYWPLETFTQTSSPNSLQSSIPLTLVGYSSLTYAPSCTTLSSSTISLSLSGSQYLSATISITTPGSVSLWFNLAATATGNPTLWSHGNTSVTTNAGAVRISAGNIVQVLCSGGIWTTAATLSSGAFYSTWTHIAMSAASTGVTSIYINGTRTSQLSSCGGFTFGSTTFTLGRPLAGSTSNGDWFVGSLDDIAVWSTTLRGGTVARLFSGVTPADFPPASLT